MPHQIIHKKMKKEIEFFSKILTGEEDLGLSEAIRQKVDPSPKFTLLFRQSRDGKEGTTFHRLCDKKERTLIIIRSKPLEKGEIGHVFGGYL